MLQYLAVRSYHSQGDAFLKYLSSLYVYALNPYDSEGELHTSRQRYISNQQLCDITSLIGLPGYIQVKPFNLKSWMPPGMRLEDPQRKTNSAAESTGSTNNVTSSEKNLTSRKSKEPMTQDLGKRPRNRKKHSKQNTPLSSIASKVVTPLRSLYLGY